MNFTLTVLDTAGIQPYIFNSNELRENIGASHLAYMATTHWVQEVLSQPGIGLAKHNYQVKENGADPYNDQFRLETETANGRAEVVYAGGGNTIILFAGDGHADIAKKFVYELSKKVIAEAPGLQLYAVHKQYTWGDNLPQAIDEAMQELGQLKAHLPVYTPVLGLSVTASCASIGLPANGEHLDPDKTGKSFEYMEEEGNGRATLANRASRQVITQWHTTSEARKRLHNMFPFVEDNGFHWTGNLDKIGKLPGRDESLIAVIHADGNGMGRRILVLGEIFGKFFHDQPRAYINAMRQLSLSFQKTATEALVKTVEKLTETLLKRKKQEEILYHIGKSKDGSDYPCFPLRPIVFGGDDVTFVSTGAWGLALAQQYLAYLEEGDKIPGFKTLFAAHLPTGLETEIQGALAYAQDQNIDVKDSPPYACAGVSIVKTHYPISRAYSNSSDLAKSAKKMVLAYIPEKTASAIDWHFTTTGLTGELNEIREREYESSELMPNSICQAVDDEQPYPLPMRPLMLRSTHTWRNWDNFLILFKRFETGWANGRNKMLALRETLHEGPTATAEFENLEKRGGFLPALTPTTSVAGLSLQQDKGWMIWQDEKTATTHLGNWRTANELDLLKRELNEVRCVYFDAIEMQEQFLALD